MDGDIIAALRLDFKSYLVAIINFTVGHHPAFADINQALIELGQRHSIGRDGYIELASAFVKMCRRSDPCDTIFKGIKHDGHDIAGGIPAGCLATTFKTKPFSMYLQMQIKPVQ